MTATPPGWYDDGHGAMRWWDGANWTEHVATPDADEPEAQQTAVTVPLYPGVQADADTVPLNPAAGTAPYPSGYAGEPESPYHGDYPAVYPTDGGAFIAATEPHKSRLWIVWVVLGILVLAIVIGFSVVIPLYALAIPAGGSSSGQSAAPTPTEEAADAVPSNADEQAAVDAVELYDHAYQTGDCDDYLTSTTAEFRAAIEVSDCAAFATVASDFDAAFDDYVTTVTSVEQDGDSITILTTETYTSPYDSDGNKTDEPQSYEDDYEYVIVPADGRWAINESYTY